MNRIESFLSKLNQLKSGVILDQNHTSTRKARYRRMNYLRMAGSSVGCCIGIGLVEYFSTAGYSALAVPSFGASCAIGMIIPASAFAQPRNVVGGHLLSGIIGLVCGHYLGAFWWTFAIAVGLSTLLMQVTRTFHPPAAADPILFMTQAGDAPLSSITLLFIGTLILVAFFAVYHRLVTKRPYPQCWL